MKIQSLNDYLTQAWCKLVAFSRDEKGASGIEYVLIATIAAVAIALFLQGTDVGEIVKNILDKFGNAITDVDPGEQS